MGTLSRDTPGSVSYTHLDVYKRQVLEIDPPRDEVSIRRQHFYERCGFTANPYRHVHPPYRAGYQGHPLVVMTCPAPASQEEYDRFAAYLGGTVMEDCKIPLTETEE